ncbi:MAG: hypothetical protein GC203_20430 [Phenylobacterium sp.]|uniref:hypothetical protein n=1 Tax=Phenylobacterium sp. TaxID=1871053 RepID=UPI0025E1A962|nr:hypothetical protein [Phenylobacterium sp.]MBI1200232.1 hypothetical protein [Phenylobacterium sp.]
MSWEIGFGLGALLLGLGLAYGLYQSAHASRAQNVRGEVGAHRLYDSPGESDRSPDHHPNRTVPPLVFIICGLLLAWLVFAGVMAERSSRDDAATRLTVEGAAAAAPLSRPEA